MQIWASLVIAGLVLALPRTVLAQKKPTLAEAAKTREQQKADPPPTKVYTNKDLPKVTPATSTTETNPAAKPEPTPAVSKDAARLAGGKDEAYWKDRMRVLLLKLDDDLGTAAAAQLRVNQLNRQGARGLSVLALNAERLHAGTELSRLIGIVGNDRRAVSDLEEEARRAGVPPGWIRIETAPPAPPSPR